MAINELRAIATFAKAVELGSIRRAAQAQGVSPQAASQAIAQLEQHLGVRLLHRTTRSLALTEEGVVGRLLFPIQLIVCAAPEYLARHGVPRSIDELGAHRCSVFRHPVTGQLTTWYLQVDGEVERRPMSPAFTTNDTELELQAVLSGQVIGQLANFAAAAHLRSGRLVPLLLPHISSHMGLHVYYGNRTALPKRVRAFVDLAVQRLLDSDEQVLGAKELAAMAAAASPPHSASVRISRSTSCV